MSKRIPNETKHFYTLEPKDLHTPAQQGSYVKSKHKEVIAQTG